VNAKLLANPLAKPAVVLPTSSAKARRKANKFFKTVKMPPVQQTAFFMIGM